MKKTVFRKFLTVLAITLLLCLFVYPLMLPSENYFRMVLQMLPLTLLCGAAMLIPLLMMSTNFSRRTANELKKLRLDSKRTLADFPELRPVARQIASLRAQIDTQMNALTGQQEQLQVLTDNMQEGLLLITAVGRVLSSNRAAFSLLGAEPIDRDSFRVFDLNDSEAFTRLVRRALDGIRGSAVIQVNESTVQIIANPISGESSMSGAVLVLLDVTEREQRDALRREFTSNVSHELKTPLTAIYGIADMMKSGMVRQEDIIGFAGRICDESSRMISLVEDIIRLSRLDDESFTEEVVPLDLFEIAENVLGQLRPAAETRNITITLDGSEAKMQGVPVIVEQMLYNLCDNAIKYNVENGKVQMKVSGTDQHTIFTVTDTGIGIPKAERMRIFERFYRVDKSHSRQIGGTGLGLSIVKHGAQFHHALIEVTSQVGSGTTIRLIFPLNAEAAEDEEYTARKDPLNVDIPGASGHALIQILDAEPDEMHAEETEPTEPEEEQETFAEDAAEPDDEPEADADEPDDDADEPEEDADEPDDGTEDDTEEPDDDEADAYEPDDDDTDAWIREAEAALDLNFDEPDADEPEAEPEEVPVHEKTREIDVVPIDEDTMDIKL